MHNCPAWPRIHKRVRKILMIVVIVGASGSPGAQWFKYPSPRAPRTANGDVDLTAAPPRLANGRPDLSGVWMTAEPLCVIRGTAPISELLKMNPPSRFIDDIPSDHLAVREQPAPPRPPAGHLVRAPRPSRYEQPSHDEFDQRVFEDDVPAYPIDAGSNGNRASPVAAGATVRHQSFGTGRVLEVRGSGKDQKLLIDFTTVGLKTVLARFVSTD